MRFAIALLVLALPLLELALLIKFGQLFGVGPTLAVVVATALLGIVVIRRQGVVTLKRAGDALETGGDAMVPVLEGFLQFAAGLLLVLPGLITDLVGTVLLIPPIRRLAARLAMERFARAGSVRVEVFRPTSRESRTERPPVIEGEFERLDETTVDPSRRKDGEGSSSSAGPGSDTPSPWRK